MAEGCLTHTEIVGMSEEELVLEYENFVSYIEAKNAAQEKAMEEAKR